MRVLLVRAAVSVTALSLVATACDNGSTGLTKEEWIKAAAAICTETNADFNKLFETDFPTTPEKLVTFFEKATPIAERRVGDLRELDAPEADADKIEEVLATGDKLVDDFRDAAKNPEKATEVFGAEGGDNATAFDEGMTDLGVPECAEDEEEAAGDENLPDPSSFSPEKKAFVEAGDAACEASDAKTDPAEEQYFANFPPPLEDWAKLLDVIIPAVEGQLAAFEGLEPPAEDADRIAELLAESRSILEELNKMKAAADAGDQEAFDVLFQPLPPRFDASDQAYREYGFQVCGAADE